MHIAHWCNYSHEKLKIRHDALLFLSDFSVSYSGIHEHLARALCCIGAAANLAFIIVLLRPSMRSPINILLLLIALCDMVTMIFYFIYRNLMEHCFRYGMNLPWAVFTLIYANVSVFAHSLSLWLTVLMAVIRFLIIKRNRTSADKFNKTKTSAYFAAIVTTFVTLACVPNMIRNQIQANKVHPADCLRPDQNWTVTKTELRDPDSVLIMLYQVNPPMWWSCSLEKLNFWLAGILFKIVPCILLCVFMGLLIYSLFEAKRRHERLISRTSSTTNLHERTTVMLILIVFVFLVTELPQGILVLTIAVDMGGLMVYLYVGDILDLLSLINSSINFLLYCSMSEQFRKQFLLTFGCDRFLSGASNQTTQSARTKTESCADIERVPMLPNNGIRTPRVGETRL